MMSNVTLICSREKQPAAGVIYDYLDKEGYADQLDKGYRVLNYQDPTKPKVKFKLMKKWMTLGECLDRIMVRGINFKVFSKKKEEKNGGPRSKGPGMYYRARGKKKGEPLRGGGGKGLP